MISTLNNSNGFSFAFACPAVLAYSSHLQEQYPTSRPQISRRWAVGDFLSHYVALCPLGATAASELGLVVWPPRINGVRKGTRCK